MEDHACSAPTLGRLQDETMHVFDWSLSITYFVTPGYCTRGILSKRDIVQEGHCPGEILSKRDIVQDGFLRRDFVLHPTFLLPHPTGIHEMIATKSYEQLAIFAAGQFCTATECL